MTQVGIITSLEFAHAAENQMLKEALEQQGVSSVIVAWDDPSVDWTSFKLLKLRSAWNYHLNFDAFMDWLNQIDQLSCQVWNNTQTLRENITKRYLQTVEKQGIPIMPSEFFTNSDVGLMRSVLKQRGWNKVVIKPAVSASAYQTVTATVDELDEHQARFDLILKTSEILIQPFLTAVQETGEYSFVFIDNELTHTVLKTPNQGDFRTQSEFDSSSKVVAPTSGQIKQARRALIASCDHALYARIDMIPDGDTLLLSESELIDPELLMRFNPDSTEKLAKAIVKRLSI